MSPRARGRWGGKLGRDRVSTLARHSLGPLLPVESACPLRPFLPCAHLGDCAMILDKARALICAGFLCFVVGGYARAAEVYPGCAQPGPIGKVWWVDPMNGKAPAAGGLGTKAAPWNSLQSILSPKIQSGYARPLLSSVPYVHVADGKRVYVADQLGDPPVQPGDSIMLMTAITATSASAITNARSSTELT